MIRLFPDRAQLARAAAFHAARSLRRLLGQNSTVRLLAATGASQLDFLQNLTQESGIDWARVELFHLDEYVGLDREHPASFARLHKRKDRRTARNWQVPPFRRLARPVRDGPRDGRCAGSRAGPPGVLRDR